MAVNVGLYFQDAVTAFKGSETGKGKSALPGCDAKAVVQYREITRKALQRIDELLGKDRIRFAQTDEGTAAQHHEGKDELQLSVRGLPKGTDGSVLTEANLPAVSLLVVHEGVHAGLTLSVVEEEMHCRVLHALYAEELRKGVSIDSKAFGKKLTVKLQAKSPGSEQAAKYYRMFRDNTLIDDILASPSYSYDLTAALAERMISSNLWGGIRRRTPVSKGIILGKLVESRERLSLDWIMVLLESVPNIAAWQQMMKYAMPNPTAKTNLKYAFERLNSHLADRCSALRRRFAKPWP